MVFSVLSLWLPLPVLVSPCLLFMVNCVFVLYLRSDILVSTLFPCSYQLLSCLLLMYLCLLIIWIMTSACWLSLCLALLKSVFWYIVRLSLPITIRNTRKHREHSVDYKYTGEWMLYAGILGSKEELNNYKRWETHEGNTDVTRVTRYVGRIMHKP